MIKKNKYIHILFLLFLLIIIPVSFASDNTTSEVIGENIEVINDTLTISNDEEILRTDDVYFDASATSNGDGTQNKPYKTVTSSYLGTTNHFASGTYTISSSLSLYTSYSGMSFIGEDKNSTILQYIGNDAFIKTSNSITFNGLTIKGGSIQTSGGTLTATDTIFDSCVAFEETESDNYKYGNSYGGAIKQTTSTGLDWGSIFGGESSSSQTIIINNCIFKNNYAAYGGAIYSEKGTITITNSKFENNNAENGGGAISALNNAKLTIDNCEFYNDDSLYDAGGSIYLFNVTSALIKNSEFNNCNAAIGGAIASLISPVTITNSNFNSNKANWTGGAVFAMYGDLIVKNSNFYENFAFNGGAIYADNLTNFELNSGIFQKNIANGTAGAIFAFTNKVNKITNITYSSNTANEYDDLYQSDRISLNIGSEDYEMIEYKSSYTGLLPSKYDLRTQNEVTPVKDQGQSGNCWAFATMATLESAILKATGKTLILSEGNLKNLANIYSDIGWRYETNNGGMYPFVYGYLTSWAGPVLASLDPTDDWDVIAPIINSAVHVQNILFLQRTSFTDNNAIKKAIMDYGAVCSEIYWSSSYLNGNNYYYSGSESRNHAISVVGWDDTKTISGAPGSGAWIIKNSYGSHRGDGGYYYVSYYDKSLFRVYDESYNSFAVVFNDTIRFNKNYQYDPAFTDYFLTPTMNKVMWYKNTFTSTGNDILSAFSTYFRKVTTWEAEIFVNDELKLTQTGKVNPGYWTINLDEKIPLKLGDNFTISLKIECSSSADIPISEYGAEYTMVKEYFQPGVSFFSTDGETWTDFYGYTSTFGSGESGHNYYNQVACIKAFTSQGSEEFLNTSIEILSSNSTVIVLIISDQNGGSVNIGEVEVIIDDNKYNANVSKSLAYINTYLKTGHHNIQVKYIKNEYYNSSNITTTITLPKENPIILITANDVQYGEELEVSIAFNNAIAQSIDVPFTVEINGITYSQKQIKINNLTPKKYAINVQTSATNDFNAKLTSKTVTVFPATPTLNLEINDVNVGEKIIIKATLSNNITGTVNITINNECYQLTVDHGKGELQIDNTLTANKYTATAKFSGNNYYSNANASKIFNVNKFKTELTIFDNDIVEGENAIIKVYLPSDITDELILTINSNKLTARPLNGEAIFNISGLTLGSYPYNVTFQGNNKYESKIVSDSLNVLQKAKKDADLKVENTINDNDIIITVNLQEDVNDEVILNFDTLKFTKTLKDGKASFKINNLDDGDYKYNVVFNGDANYKSARYENTITVKTQTSFKSTIDADNMSRTFLSSYDYEARFYDNYNNLLAEKEVLFIVSGNEYNVKTNKYGVAKLSNKFSVGNYIVNICNLATGENLTRTMTIVNRISDNKNINMDYNDGTVFKVRVYGDNSQLVGAGEIVTFKISGKTYNVLTDNKGFATLKLDLTPKSYSITTSYKGVTVVNKIVVKQVLKAKNISKKKSSKVKFSVTLKTSKGKGIIGKKIIFKIKNKKYFAKTNKQGKATITLKKLNVGKYKITSTYLKTSIVNTIRIK